MKLDCGRCKKKGEGEGEGEGKGRIGKENELRESIGRAMRRVYPAQCSTAGLLEVNQLLSSMRQKKGERRKEGRERCTKVLQENSSEAAYSIPPPSPPPSASFSFCV